MPDTRLRRARVDKPVIVTLMTGALDMLRPGEYYVEDAGLSMRIHQDATGEIHAVAEVKMSAFDALLAERRVVFLSWS